MKVVAVSSRALEVSWDPPPPNTTHGPILGYHLGYSLATSSSNNQVYNFTHVGGESSVGGVGRVRVGELHPHTRYALVLRAFNSKGAGPISSPPSIATTLEDKPSAPPQDVRCQQGGSGDVAGGGSATSLTVTWAPPPPDHRNGDLTSYRVTFWPVEEDVPGIGGVEERALGGEQMVAGGARGRAVLEGLRAWTNYSISVAASTRAGRGQASQPHICTTAQDVPSSPALIKALVSGPRAVVVSWSPPAHPNGPLTHYTVKWVEAGMSMSTAQSKRVEPSETHVTLHDLPYTMHQVWVTAATRVGEGPSSTRTRVRPSHTVPAGVWSVGGQVRAGRGEGVSLRCGAVGVPHPRLAWTHQGAPLPLANNRVVMSDGGSTLSIGALEREDSGRYTCTATNPHGRDSVIYHLTVLVPPSTPSLHVTETTASSIRVQWGVTDTGGAPLLGATLHYRAAGDEWKEVEVDVEERTHIAKDLRCGSIHHLYLTAHNRVGRSDPSRTEEARTKGRPPQPPPQFQFVTTNSSQATLYLSQWSDGGCPIHRFTVEYRMGRTGAWTTVGSEIRPARTYALGGLEGGQEYQLQVTAHNAAGSTPAHYTVTTPAHGILGEGVGVGAGMGVWDGSGQPHPQAAWRDPRVVVPAAVSTLALALTLATLCLCLRKRPQPLSQKPSPSRGPMADVIEEKSVSAAATQQQEEQLYTTIRCPAPTPPHHLHHHHHHHHQHHQQQHNGDSTDDYPSEELYHYAAGYQSSGAASPPPPPAPPSPPSHHHGRHPSHHTPQQQQQPHPQKAFTALVYQAPSLHDVDASNYSDGGGRIGPSGGGDGAVDSQSEGYGSLLGPGGGGGGMGGNSSSPPTPPGPPQQTRPPRHSRTSRIIRSVRFP